MVRSIHSSMTLRFTRDRLTRFLYTEGNLVDFNALLMARASATEAVPLIDGIIIEYVVSFIAEFLRRVFIRYSMLALSELLLLCQLACIN